MINRSGAGSGFKSPFHLQEWEEKSDAVIHNPIILSSGWYIYTLLIPYSFKSVLNDDSREVDVFSSHWNFRECVTSGLFLSSGLLIYSFSLFCVFSDRSVLAGLPGAFRCVSNRKDERRTAAIRKRC